VTFNFLAVNPSDAVKTFLFEDTCKEWHRCQDGGVGRYLATGILLYKVVRQSTELAYHFLHCN